MAELVLSNSITTTRMQGFPATHGITTKRFANFGINGNSVEKENNLLLMKEMRRNSFHKIITDHRGAIIQTNPNGRVDNYFTADALICLRPKSNQRPILIANTADCPVIFLTDNIKSFVSIVHSGRAETEINIVGKTISKLKNAFNISPENIIAGLWPGICRFCYPVYFRQEILDQLIGAGVDGFNIHIAENVCSAHSLCQGDFLFSSFRRDRNGERNAAFITF